MKRQNLRTVSLIVVTFTYLLIGAAIFGYLESEHEIAQRNHLDLIEMIVRRKYNITDDDWDVLSTNVIRQMPHKAGTQWKFAGAFYFATTVVTTIGYGHSTPSTMAGRSFCMVYALIGIPLGLVMFQSIGERLNTFVGNALKRFKQCFQARDPEVTQTNLVMVVSVLSTLLMTSMAAVFAQYERWEYFDALYYCFITLTTIGFGDFVALQKEGALQTKPEYVSLSLIFILFGLSVVSSAVNLLVLKFLTLNTEDERRDEQMRYTAALNPIKLEGDVITSPAGQWTYASQATAPTPNTITSITIPTTKDITKTTTTTTKKQRRLNNNNNNISLSGSLSALSSSSERSSTKSHASLSSSKTKSPVSSSVSGLEFVQERCHVTNLISKQQRAQNLHFAEINVNTAGIAPSTSCGNDDSFVRRRRCSKLSKQTDDVEAVVRTRPRQPALVDGCRNNQLITNIKYHNKSDDEDNDDKDKDNENSDKDDGDDEDENDVIEEHDLHCFECQHYICDQNATINNNPINNTRASYEALHHYGCHQCAATATTTTTTIEHDHCYNNHEQMPLVANKQQTTCTSSSQLTNTLTFQCHNHHINLRQCQQSNVSFQRRNHKQHQHRSATTHIKQLDDEYVRSSSSASTFDEQQAQDSSSMNGADEGHKLRARRHRRRCNTSSVQQQQQDSIHELSPVCLSQHSPYRALRQSSCSCSLSSPAISLNRHMHQSTTSGGAQQQQHMTTTDHSKTSALIDSNELTNRSLSSLPVEQEKQQMVDCIHDANDSSTSHADTFLHEAHCSNNQRQKKRPAQIEKCNSLSIDDLPTAASICAILAPVIAESKSLPVTRLVCTCCCQHAECIEHAFAAENYHDKCDVHENENDDDDDNDQEQLE